MKHLTILISLFIINITFAQENTPITCSDGIDNDGDGLFDCLDNECFNLPNNGCQTCFDDGLSFADFVVDYNQNCSGNTHTNPETAIGVSDFRTVDADEYVSLGTEGYITLGFNNNLLVNSGDNGPDLWVFEIGPAVEPSQIDLKPYDQNTINILINAGIEDADFDGYYEFDVISGSTSSLDIDAYVVGYSQSELLFDAVKIINATPGSCGNNSTPGADIDAVCALSSLMVDCEGTPNGTAQVDDCGNCLELNDPNFNQSCIDCAGIPNGTSLVDDCGNCLELDDPNFDQTCLDCKGIPNGTAQVDDCSNCLELDDPNFNQSCIDCAGIPNGTSLVDDCGNCLELNDPNFNQSCIDCAGIPNGTSLVDDCGNCLELDDPNFNQSCIDCAGAPNGLAQIDNCGNCLELDDPNFNQSCVDCDGVLNGTALFDKCGECLQFSDVNFNKLCITIPNAFSANNDGVNDYFKLFAREGTNPTIQLYQIFNRWGELVYEKKDFNLRSDNFWWGGKDSSGKNVEIGVYTYFILVRFENMEQKNFKGNVTVIR